MIKSASASVYATHTVVVKTSLDITAVALVGVNMISKYLIKLYNTTACTLSFSSAPTVWLHGLSLHNCGTSI